MSATYHFTFTGEQPAKATIRIADSKVTVRAGHHDEPDVRVTADAATWVAILNREYPMLKAIILRKVRVKGDMALFRAFGRCFAG